MSVHTAICRSAISAISGYQRHISPRKGFSCAYRILTGSASCSEHIKQLIIAFGLVEGMRQSRARFRLCKEAASVLRQQRNAGEPLMRIDDDQNRSDSAPRDRRPGSSSSPGSNCDFFDDSTACCAVYNIADCGCQLASLADLCAGPGAAFACWPW